MDKGRITNRSQFDRPKKATLIKGNAIYVYDEIGYFGITADDFVDQLAELENEEIIHVHVNSPGGDVWDGQAIAAAVRRQSAKTVIHVDGLAASIASIIAIAGDELVMTKGSYLMIHEPWSIVVGTADEMRKHAEVLDKIASTFAKQYVDASDLTLEEVTVALADETWFDADEAVAFGFADGLDNGDAVNGKYDLSMYGKVPDSLMSSDDMSFREIEKALRKTGMSRSEAVAFASAGKRAVDDKRDSCNRSGKDGQSDSVSPEEMAELDRLNKIIGT